MREIKVRVWDIDGGKMSAGFSFDKLIQNEIEIEFPDSDESLPFNDFVVFRKEFSDFMLWTGLKDKNGVEIYQGDIVICHPEIKYGRREIKIDMYEGFNHGDGGSFEIIGNIYETPNK